MNPSKSLYSILIVILVLVIIILGFTLSKMNDLEQRISKLENEIENPRVRIIPAD